MAFANKAVYWHLVKIDTPLLFLLYTTVGKLQYFYITSNPIITIIKPLAVSNSYCTLSLYFDGNISRAFILKENSSFSENTSHYKSSEVL